MTWLGQTRHAGHTVGTGLRALSGSRFGYLILHDACIDPWVWHMFTLTWMQAMRIGR